MLIRVCRLHNLEFIRYIRIGEIKILPYVISWLYEKNKENKNTSTHIIECLIR